LDDIEFEAPRHATCACCGRRTTRLTRFVTRDGDAFAVYLVMYTEGHEDRDAWALVGLGRWGEDAPPETGRAAFALRLWLADDSYKVSVVDAEHAPWDTGFLGRRLSREEALQHPWLEEVFALSDQMVVRDQPLIDHLNGRASGTSGTSE
jgi:hypothetical protein